MKTKVHYGTVTEALKYFTEKGYLTDFNLKQNCISFKNENKDQDHLKIVEVFRYEGASNPDDESTVYAIESSSGIKGVLVTGYSYDHNQCTQDILDKLHY